MCLAPVVLILTCGPMVVSAFGQLSPSGKKYLLPGHPQTIEALSVQFLSGASPGRR